MPPGISPRGGRGMSADSSDSVYGPSSPATHHPFPTFRETHTYQGPDHPARPWIQESVILPMQVRFSCQLGVHGSLGEARAASQAGLLFPSGGFYLSLPGYLGWDGWGRGAVLGLVMGYQQLGFRALGVKRGHRVAGREEVRAGCASLECDEKYKTLDSIQSQLLSWVSFKLDQVTLVMVFLWDICLSLWLFLE